MDASHGGDGSHCRDGSYSAEHAGHSGNSAGSSKPPIITDQAEDTSAPLSTGWDQALAAAMHDVPLPPGLSARLLARLPEPAIAADRRAAGHRIAGHRPIGRLAGRRRWLRAAAASLACAASVTVAIMYFHQTAPDMGSESVMESVRAWHNHLADLGQPGGWGPLHRDAPPEDYPSGSLVVADCVEGWQLLPAPLLGRQGVAYQLVGPHQNRATLYVLDFDGPRSAPRLLLNATSPLENLLTTDGQTSSAWTDGVRLYVLVADGNEQDFRTLVRAPRSMA
ncbi:MAG TPA: hypothetical protein VG433_16305 [Pirellulales bacterium]|jgi:hypothetical protein|nr:hypothetical protein [Pirellulales bacterium]